MNTSDRNKQDSLPSSSGLERAAGSQRKQLAVRTKLRAGQEKAYLKFEIKDVIISS